MAVKGAGLRKFEGTADAQANKPYREIECCRICKNDRLVPVLSLGHQALTGVFPRTRDQKVAAGPLDLVRCDGSASPEACGLTQLKQSYDKNEMYGDDYGYRSGLNPSMVAHLRDRVTKIASMIDLRSTDVVLDIGSNDGTLLGLYPSGGPTLVGMDPTGKKFGHFYPPHVHLIPDFFSAEAFLQHTGGRRARAITSIAMFYDLEEPLEFVRQIGAALADDGLWVFEQSYLPSMLQTTAYDTVCHEHLEYYGLKQIEWMLSRSGFRIVSVELNDTNGGSFAVTAAKAATPSSAEPAVRALLEEERRAGLETAAPYEDFAARVRRHKTDLVDQLAKIREGGHSLAGYGASTKGNVILQYCELTPADLPYIGEVNEDKFGCFTPGTLIPILPENEVKARKPDYLLVLPWHFKDFIVRKESAYIAGGGHLLFPLPSLTVVAR